MFFKCLHDFIMGCRKLQTFLLLWVFSTVPTKVVFQATDPGVEWVASTGYKHQEMGSGRKFLVFGQ